MPACKWRFSALPVLTYLNVRSAPVLEIHHFGRCAPSSIPARPDLNLKTSWSSFGGRQKSSDELGQAEFFRVKMRASLLYWDKLS
jgi:hypothetical protein